MNWTTPSKSRSFMRYAFITVFLLITGLGHVALSEVSINCNSKKIKEMCAAGSTERTKDENKDICRTFDLNCEDRDTSSNSSGEARCQALLSKVNEASRIYNERCSDAGISTNCTGTVRKCESIGEKGTRSEMYGALAEAIGAPASLQRDACTNMTGREYKDEKKELQDALKDANAEMAEADKDKTDLNEEYNKAVAEIDKEVADLQAKYKADQVKAGKDGRDAKSQIEQTMLQARANRRAKEALKIKLEGELTRMLTDKNAQLDELMDDRIIQTCFDQASAMKPVNKDHKQSGNLISANNAKAKAQAAMYKSCKNSLQNRRLTIIQNFQDMIRQKEQQIRDNQSEIDDLDQQVASAQTEFELQMRDQNTQKNDALTALNQTIELANKKRTALDLNNAEKGKNLDAKKDLAKRNAEQASNNMLLLGPQPPKLSSDVSTAKAYSAYQQLQEAENDYDTYSYKGVLDPDDDDDDDKGKAKKSQDNTPGKKTKIYCDKRPRATEQKKASGTSRTKERKTR